ncbi:hypothetical protein J6590_031238 [Homalodisca vitripennis]|nr:hypothetical protein J6590_031238 [Homalodisca vitripennis]
MLRHVFPVAPVTASRKVLSCKKKKRNAERRGEGSDLDLQQSTLYTIAPWLRCASLSPSLSVECQRLGIPALLEMPPGFLPLKLTSS